MSTTNGYLYMSWFQEQQEIEAETRERSRIDYDEVKLHCNQFNIGDFIKFMGVCEEQDSHGEILRFEEEDTAIVRDQYGEERVAWLPVSKKITTNILYQRCKQCGKPLPHKWCK